MTIDERDYLTHSRLQTTNLLQPVEYLNFMKYIRRANFIFFQIVEEPSTGSDSDYSR